MGQIFVRASMRAKAYTRNTSLNFSGVKLPKAKGIKGTTKRVSVYDSLSPKQRRRWASMDRMDAKAAAKKNYR